jgi:hypothetical protein
MEEPVVCSALNSINQPKKDRFTLIVLDRDPECLRIIKVCDSKEDLFIVKKMDIVSLGLLRSKTAQPFVKNLTAEFRHSLIDWGIDDLKLRMNSSFLDLNKSLLKTICEEDLSVSKRCLYQEILALISTNALIIPIQPSKLMVFSNLK